jgi:hypothetical protein
MQRHVTHHPFGALDALHVSEVLMGGARVGGRGSRLSGQRPPAPWRVKSVYNFLIIHNVLHNTTTHSSYVFERQSSIETMMLCENDDNAYTLSEIKKCFEPLSQFRTAQGIC